MSCFGHHLRCKQKVLFLAIVHKYIEDADVDKAYTNKIYAHCNIDCICETSRQITTTTTRILSSFVDDILFLLLLRTILYTPFCTRRILRAKRNPIHSMFQSPTNTSYKMSSNP